MNKCAILLIIIVLGLSQSAAPSPTSIKDISKPIGGKTGEKTSIVFAITEGALKADDIIIMSTIEDAAQIPATDPRATVAIIESSATTIAAEFYFPLPGTYYVFVQNSEGTIQQKDDVHSLKVTFAVTGPENYLIIRVEASEPKAGKAIRYTFTHTWGLARGDKIIFSSTKNLVPATTDFSFTLSDETTDFSFVKELTIPHAGTFSIFLSRTTGVTKQTAPAIVISSSGFISMTFAVLLGLLLF